MILEGHTARTFDLWPCQIAPVGAYSSDLIENVPRGYKPHGVAQASCEIEKETSVRAGITRRVGYFGHTLNPALKEWSRNDPDLESLHSDPAFTSIHEE